MSNERYRPHTKSGPKLGRDEERYAAEKANARFMERFMERFTAAAKRNGWIVREVLQ